VNRGERRRAGAAAMLGLLYDFLGLLSSTFGRLLGWQLATQRREDSDPLFLASRFAGPEVDTQRPELLSATCLGSIAEDVLAPGDLEVNETGGHDRGL
jgi:hypothetical protein